MSPRFTINPLHDFTLVGVVDLRWIAPFHGPVDHPQAGAGNTDLHVVELCIPVVVVKLIRSVRASKNKRCSYNTLDLRAYGEGVDASMVFYVVVLRRRKLRLAAATHERFFPAARNGKANGHEPQRSRIPKVVHVIDRVASESSPSADLYGEGFLRSVLADDPPSCLHLLLPSPSSRSGNSLYHHLRSSLISYKALIDDNASSLPTHPIVIGKEAGPLVGVDIVRIRLSECQNHHPRRSKSQRVSFRP